MYTYFKRCFDLTAAVFGLLILSPFLALVALAVYLDLGFPVIFSQRRVGYRDRLFHVFKFRTMSDERDEKGDLLPDERRLSRLGRLIRALSLDEFPQLWNVVRGEMSLVGPRPLLPEYLPRYSEKHRRRHSVMPGITGWAQVHGRNLLSWREKFDLDVWYVENRSFLLDLKILFMTIIKVARREGVSSRREITMKPFTGYDDKAI